MLAGVSAEMLGSLAVRGEVREEAGVYVCVGHHDSLLICSANMHKWPSSRKALQTNLTFSTAYPSN